MSGYRTLHPSRMRCFILLFLGLLSGCAALLVTPNFTTELTALRSGQYSLDPEHAYANFRVQHLGLSSIIGRFNTVQGSLDFDPDKIGSMALQGKLLASSIDVNNDELEQRLLGSDWLGAERFPEIEFKSTNAVMNNQGNIEIAGELSMRGEVRPVTLEATFHGGADNILTGKYTLGFSAMASIKRSDYGMDAFAALVGDEITIELHGEFQRN